MPASQQLGVLVWPRHLLTLSLLMGVALPAASATLPDVKIERRDDAFAVSVVTPVAASAAIAWQVLTDYNHLAEFVPDMRSSRLLSAAGEPLRLEQIGDTGFLIFRFAVDVELAIEETPPVRVGFSLVRGNMRRMKGAWRIDEADTGIRLLYEAEIEPAFWVPPVIGPAVLRANIANQIAGVVHEMERRQESIASRSNQKK